MVSVALYGPGVGSSALATGGARVSLLDSGLGVEAGGSVGVALLALVEFTAS